MKTNYTQLLINKPKLLTDVISQTLSIDIKVKTRQKDYIEARFIYFYILRNKENMRLNAIGNTLAMNHASVLHGCKKAKIWIDFDYTFANKYLSCLENYYKEVYDISKQDELIELKNKIDSKRIVKVKNVYSDEEVCGKRPMKRINNAYAKLHMLIDKTPENKADDLLIRVEAIYNMMISDLKRNRI